MYRYASSTKDNTFRSDSPITGEQFARYAPSVLATEAHHSRSDRYTVIPTIEVLRGMWREGFAPYEVRQSRTRDESKREFTRHMVRLRHRSLIGSQDEVPEIILINSHDGASSYQLLAGYFRFVCSNGLIAGDVTTDVRVRHSGDVVNNVIEGSFEVLNNVQEIEHRKEALKSIELSRSEQLLLANEAVKLRWDDSAPVSADRILIPHRHQDAAPTLWNTYNVIQENLIKGGQRGRASTGRRLTTRPITGVQQDVKLNRALWQLAEGMRQLKEAA
jgi:hypothetical protein